MAIEPHPRASRGLGQNRGDDILVDLPEDLERRHEIVESVDLLLETAEQTAHQLLNTTEGCLIPGCLQPEPGVEVVAYKRRTDRSVGIVAGCVLVATGQLRLLLVLPQMGPCAMHAGRQPAP
jgi:hypothetical protein